MDDVEIATIVARGTVLTADERARLKERFQRCQDDERRAIWARLMAPGLRALDLVKDVHTLLVAEMLETVKRVKP